VQTQKFETFFMTAKIPQTQTEGTVGAGPIDSSLWPRRKPLTCL